MLVKTIAQIIGLIASAINITAIQVKDKKSLYLALSVLVKLLYAINIAMLAEYAGMVTQLISVVITIIAFIYAKKVKDIPKWMTGIFIGATVLCGILTCKRLVGIMAIMCGITYALIVSSKNMKNIRRLTLIQSILWTTYDFLIGAYTASISSAFVFVSTIIAILRYDIKKVKN